MNNNISTTAMAISLMLVPTACVQRTAETHASAQEEKQTAFTSGRSQINGITMYYEIYGEGERPLVLIHGGGSTIQTSFEKIIPLLAAQRQVIGVELQAHGRTSDRTTPSSFEQDADDVATLLKNLKIPKADFLGFSNGANTTMQIAIRHPEVVSRIIVASGFYKRSGMQPWFWDMMKHATIANMPQVLKDAFLKVTPDSTKLQRMFERDSRRMLGFRDWTDEQLNGIHAPTLVVASDADVMTPEHAVEMFRLIPDCELMILPGGMASTWAKSVSRNAKKERQHLCR